MGKHSRSSAILIKYVKVKFIVLKSKLTLMLLFCCRLFFPDISGFFRVNDNYNVSVS